MKNRLKLRLLIAFVLFWVPVIIFARLASEIVEQDPVWLDAAFLQWLHGYASPTLDSVFYVITTFGNAETIIAVTLAICAFLIYKKRYSRAIIMAFIVGGAAIANFVLKALFQRDRPSFWHSMVTETSYSFPSGHAMISAALILGIVFLLWRTRWRTVSIIAGGALVLLIGLSRLYFGVHYPTDIVAGWCVSAAWVIIVLMISWKPSLSTGISTNIKSS